jgi:antitoxin MazE
MGSVKTSIVRIGNSQGIRIPKTLIEQCRLDKEVELEPQGDQIVIRSVSKLREGWEEEFKTMAERGDDRPLGNMAVAGSWDEEEWEW